MTPRSMSERGRDAAVDIQHVAVDEAGRVGVKENRRADQFRREYDFVPDGDEPDNYRKRLDWLKREGALSDEDVEKRWASFMAASGRDERQDGLVRVLN